jgi:hypothetical protein
LSDQDNVARAREYGARGRRLPADMRGDPAYEAAHHEARTARKLARRSDSPRTSHPLLGRPPATRPPTSSPAGASPATRPAKTRPAGLARKANYLSRAFSPSRAAKRVGLGKVAGAGDAGGLLLALVAYPLFLSVIKYGGDGPGLWFRAKWLNQAAGTSGKTKPGVTRGGPVGPGSGPIDPGAGGGAGGGGRPPVMIR